MGNVCACAYVVHVCECGKILIYSIAWYFGVSIECTRTGTGPQNECSEIQPLRPTVTSVGRAGREENENFLKYVDRVLPGATETDLGLDFTPTPAQGQMIPTTINYTLIHSEALNETVFILIPLKNIEFNENVKK